MILFAACLLGRAREAKASKDCVQVTNLHLYLDVNRGCTAMRVVGPREGLLHHDEVLYSIVMVAPFGMFTPMATSLFSLEWKLPPNLTVSTSTAHISATVGPIVYCHTISEIADHAPQLSLFCITQKWLSIGVGIGVAFKIAIALQ